MISSAREAAQPVPELTLLNDEGALTAGQPFDLRFSLTDPETGEGLADLQDVLILAAQTAGNWNTRQAATSLGDFGFGCRQLRQVVEARRSAEVPDS